MKHKTHVRNLSAITGLMILNSVACFANIGTLPKADYIVIEKSDHLLTLLRNGKEIKSYKVALGQNPVGHKEREGDKKTPEGKYKIDLKKQNSQFHLALRISYPNATDLARAQKKGVSAGGDIMIHGLKKEWDWLGERHTNRDWTAGCIAVTNTEIEEIWRLVRDGTPVEIRP